MDKDVVDCLSTLHHTVTLVTCMATAVNCTRSTEHVLLTEVPDRVVLSSTTVVV